jgi:lambda repressor-like predicted transcriptional regulator
MNGEQIIGALRRKGVTVKMVAEQTGYKPRYVTIVIDGNGSVWLKAGTVIRAAVANHLGLSINNIWDTDISPPVCKASRRHREQLMAGKKWEPLLDLRPRSTHMPGSQEGRPPLRQGRMPLLGRFKLFCRRSVFRLMLPIHNFIARSVRRSILDGRLSLPKD